MEKEIVNSDSYKNQFTYILKKSIVDIYQNNPHEVNIILYGTGILVFGIGIYKECCTLYKLC